MLTFSFEKIVLKSGLSEKEILQRLAGYIEPEKAIRFRFIWTPASKPYEGTISGNQFRLKRIINYRNSLLPQVHGSVEETVLGTLVSLQMRLPLFVRIVMGIFTALVVIGCISIASLQGKGGAIDSISLIPLAALPLMIAVMYLSYRYECRRARKDLQYLFQGEEYISH